MRVYVNIMSAVLMIIALLHIYWANGGKWGFDFIVPKLPQMVNQSLSQPKAQLFLLQFWFLQLPFCFLQRQVYSLGLG